jgi:hypothetical protein
MAVVCCFTGKEKRTAPCVIDKRGEMVYFKLGFSNHSINTMVSVS